MIFQAKRERKLMKLKSRMRVRITNPAYAEDAGKIGRLQLERVNGVDCPAVRFRDGYMIGVGEDDIRPITKRPPVRRGQR
jgi:hypothetical protein